MVHCNTINDRAFKMSMK